MGLSAGTHHGGSEVRLWRIEPTSFLCPLYPASILTYAKTIQMERDAAQLLTQVQQARQDEHIPLALILLRALCALPVSEHQRASLREWEMLIPFCQQTTLRAVQRLKVQIPPKGLYSSLNQVDLSADGSRAMSGSREKGSSIIVWDVVTGNYLLSVNVPGSCSAVSLNADGSRALALSGKASIWDVETGQLLRQFEDSSTSGCLSMDGHWYISAKGIWDVETGSCVALSRLSEQVVKLSRNGRWAITGGTSGETRVWDITQGSCVAVLNTSTQERVYHVDVDLSADGCWAITSLRNQVQVWNVAQEQCVNVFPGVGGGLVHLSTNGRWAIIRSGVNEEQIALWDVIQGQCIYTFHDAPSFLHPGEVAWSADGRYVIAGENMWELKWELEAHEMVDWDDRARSYLEAFLLLHTPYVAGLSKRLDGAVRVVTRQGRPTWTEKDFQGLLHLLQYAGYGWVRAEGVRNQLERMATPS